MRITSLYNHNSGCDYHRITQPMKYITAIDRHISVTHKDSFSLQNVYDCDILFLSRTYFDLEALKKFKERFGFKIVVDFDDSFDLYHDHPLKQAWDLYDVKKKMIDTCKMADMVFVTNEQLYNVYKPYSKAIEIIPNGIIVPEQVIKTDSTRVRFGYVGGSSHYKDLKVINNLFLKLNVDADFKRFGKLILCGYEKSPVWDIMEAMVKKAGVYERKGSLPLDKYMQHYQDIDVSIAPLENNEFNTGKSNLKFLEAGASSNPFICSDILPYTIDKNKKSAISFCNNITDWHKAFKHYINNPSSIEDDGYINYEYIKENYNLHNINKKRLEIFKSLV